MKPITRPSTQQVDSLGPAKGQEKVPGVRTDSMAPPVSTGPSQKASPLQAALGFLFGRANNDSPIRLLELAVGAHNLAQSLTDKSLQPEAKAKLANEGIEKLLGVFKGMVDVVTGSLNVAHNPQGAKDLPSAVMLPQYAAVRPDGTFEVDIPAMLSPPPVGSPWHAKRLLTACAKSETGTAMFGHYGPEVGRSLMQSYMAAHHLGVNVDAQGNVKSLLTQGDFNTQLWATPGLRGKYDSKVLHAYSEAMGGVVPEAERESVRNLAGFLRNAGPERYDIVPVLRGGTMVGGAHTQIPPTPDWKEGGVVQPFGALEYAWGVDGPATEMAIKQGLASLEASAKELGQPLPGVFVDVPMGASNRDAMIAALKAQGFDVVYQGSQPPLEKGSPPTEVMTFFKASEGAPPPTAEQKKAYFEAYWSTYDSINGDQAALRANEQYQQMAAHFDQQAHGS